MLIALKQELSVVGLEMHPDKTKILASVEQSVPSLQVEELSIDILPRSAKHKYLGRCISLNPEVRVQAEVDNRMAVAWARFDKFRRWLTIDI